MSSYSVCVVVVRVTLSFTRHKTIIRTRSSHFAYKNFKFCLLENKNNTIMLTFIIFYSTVRKRAYLYPYHFFFSILIDATSLYNLSHPLFGQESEFYERVRKKVVFLAWSVCADECSSTKNNN